MAKPDRTLQLALSNLRRSWPTTMPNFGRAIFPLPPASTLLTSDEAARLGLACAHRTTCELSAERFIQFLDSPPPRTLLVHAVDAEPGVPLLALWATRHVDALASLKTLWATELACEVLFALPLDLPESAKRSLASLAPVRWVDGNYPGGHWRLLPRAARVRGSNHLTIDSIAATDWAHAMMTGAAPTDRPIALARPDEARVDYAVVARGLHLGALTTADDASGSATRSWFAGPRIADREVAPETAIGDGELTFYREASGDRSSSACIRCGGCIAVCPTRVDPVALLRESVLSGRRDADPRTLRRAGIESCIDCGLCTAACPSNIELHHTVARLRPAPSAVGHA